MTLSTHADALGKVGLTVRGTVNRILKAWEASTDAERETGAQWYSEAQTLTEVWAARFNHSPEHVAAILSHLSPRTSWARNVAGAESLMATGKAPGCIGDNVDRAMRSLAATDPLETFGGPKTRAFYLNIIGDTDAVTVDVWAVRIAAGPAVAEPEKILTRKGVYDAVAHCYRLAASRRGVTPTTMQATTWIVARNGRAS